MRVFIAVLVLIFSLQSWIKADDISEETIKEIGLIKSLAVSINADFFIKWLRYEAY